MNAKIRQLAARVTRLEEMIMGTIVHASNNPSPPPEPTPAED
jgi:hypothetical protein